ncbi:MAG: (d)CMP kinase [Candidatus Methylopumilus sp.]|nr:(d)CMP kinase [Candidatus Methylopumilus sp.]
MISPVPVIAIDGPSASGKGTVAKLVAQKLGFHYLDSGSIYRTIAYTSHQQNISWNNEIMLIKILEKAVLSFKNDQILLNGKDVSEAIRTEEAGRGASEVAVHKKLRAAILGFQRDFEKSPGLVSEGRDMASVVFPHACMKIFLTASTQIRAERRYKQLISKGNSVNMDSVLDEIILRDERDLKREISPLLKTEDAIEIDTDTLSISDAVDKITHLYSLKSQTS